jgi:hypothetical protein
MSGAGQDGPSTRTRLPETHGAGTGRRAQPQPRRALVTVVGVVVLLIAAIAFANRGTSGGSSGDDSANGAHSSQSGSGGSNSTAASGARPVTGKSAGIPAGFAHTAEGAQSAAANYAVALGGVDMFGTASRHSVVTALYAPASAASARSELDRVYSDPAFLQRIGLRADGTAPQGMTFVSRTDPAGAKLVSYGGDRATVSVWYSALFGLAGTNSQNPVTESWYTDTFELVWSGGDWKVTGVRQKEGPTPVGRDQVASSAQEMADAVKGFGGFTYAR